MYPLLNRQQKEVYDTFMKAIDGGNGGLYFLDAPGGTGKTFLMSVVLATVRARSNIAVAVASSGIAATLLEHVIFQNTPQWPMFYQHRKSSSGTNAQWYINVHWKHFTEH